MSLPPGRTRAYTCGALTGAVGAVAALAARDERRAVALGALSASLCCGALAVAFEERTQAARTDPAS